MKKIVLASKSNDRRELFEQSGLFFEVLKTNVSEKKYKEKILDPVLLVKELAKVKANIAKRELVMKKTDAIIIAADTIVELNGEIIGKAKNKKEAFQMLKKLRGKPHNLITGIAITDTNDPRMIVDYDLTTVEFLMLTDEELYDYINTNEWKGRAGSYSIFDRAGLFINKIIGSSSNVVGFPMHKLYEIFKNEFNINLFRMMRV
ncbi:hypothetical protein LCGC14_0731880 [marine sediment metagenome]|uniref:Septum formation protein Maf n=1 Tax=marine sediment metagenome TaxID=412755 RepID=A0A0F9QDG6_9ZZZZ|nr:MAG: Maf-like protein YhdE [Candidatus Lokiarchaeum sp. GC14_75]